MNTPNGLRQLITEAVAETGIQLTAYEIAVLANQVGIRAAQRGAGHTKLPRRLIETLQALAAGENVSETAARLCISLDTVKTHRRRLYLRLGAKSGPHAVAIASRQGLLPQIGGRP